MVCASCPVACASRRAARRLEEATGGHEAQTIHRMLEWMPGREPAYRPGHPLPAGLVIVDESSMLNLRLIEVLLGGLAESTHVVFVGDADQLPPIGAGKPFADLIASDVTPVVRLTQIFRQAARSMITTAAHEINHGRQPHLEPTEE
ncbi:MAG TPA: AAA family ATPase, partial [Solirubrobacterales bacterium]|nr:AAA family ATPase [Solirubrobacterales bacterium]